MPESVDEPKLVGSDRGAMSASGLACHTPLRTPAGDLPGLRAIVPGEDPS
ncbi:hypothetical protein ACIBO5_52635 [Nonomuraea angiospora]